MKASSRLLVHEYITAGGCGADTPPEGMAAEAAAMLRAVLLDCQAWDRMQTLTLLDRRLSGLDLPAGEVLFVEPGLYPATWQSALARSEAALIIAPETGGVLAGLSRQAVAAGVRLLGASPDAVDLAGDKWSCSRRWLAAGVPTPATLLATLADAAAVAQEIGFPLVVKPPDGVDCAGVCLVTCPAELPAAAELAAGGVPDTPILLQPYLDGEHASVSLLVARGRARALSLNRQDIVPGKPFSYRGGSLPLRHPAEASALAVAEAAAEAVPGLEGYAGVDLVLYGGQAWAIELNPRLTTSYLGLRQVLDINLPAAIWAACVEGILPGAAIPTGSASYSLDSPGGLREGV
jgi:predicted ATP-grasp superfamily ATP-dependent carboligase